MFRSKPQVEAFLKALSEGANMFEGRKLHKKVLIFFLENSIEGTCIFLPTSRFPFLCSKVGNLVFSNIKFRVSIPNSSFVLAQVHKLKIKIVN
jgi:hypothetical protein